MLAAVFLRRFAEQNRRQVAGFTAAALQALETYDWPGNVRELQHAIERAVVLCRGSDVDLVDLPEALRSTATGQLPAPAAALSVPLGTPLDEIERMVIRETLRHTRGDKNLAARLLGVAPRTIYRKLERDESGRLAEPATDDEGGPQHS